MLGFYNFSIQGSSHAKTNKVCQDYSDIVKLENGWIAAAVADGVGSAEHSEIGSSAAVKTVIDFITNLNLKEWNIDELCGILKNAYKSALDIIFKIAEDEGNSIKDYDTTLTTAIYNGCQIIYGHVGDGGIVTLSDNGEYNQLTAVQKGEEFNCVEPLRNEEAWEFGFSDNNICALSMFTDGIYDVVCPWILANEVQQVYVNYIRLFMDMNIIHTETDEDFKKLKENAEEFLTSDFNSNITDDKTVAVVVNSDVMPKLQSEEYYSEPDWDFLLKEHKKHLYSSD